MLLGMFRLPSLSHSKFAACIAALVVGLGMVQLTASLLFYQYIDRQTLRDDHARRIAELLVVGERVDVLAPSRVSPVMSTRFLAASVAKEPRVAHAGDDADLPAITREIERWEPALAGKALRLDRVRGGTGEDDLVGSIRLSDGRWLNFRSSDISSMWPVAWRAIILTIVSTTGLMLVGLLLLHRLALPLRDLANAANAIGEGQRIDIAEHGPKDLRGLARAMNMMQGRIAALLQEQAQSFEAISHDLRTPLARQKVLADLLDDQELASMLAANVDEMEALLASLQQFLRAQHLAAQPETIDLTELAEAIAGPFGSAVTVHRQPGFTTTTVVEPVAISLAVLIENALQYGHRADIRFARAQDGRATISVEDDGPGLSEDHFQAVLDPFFRLDQARARNTRGFGLGIPTAHRLMTRFQGDLSFARSSAGGLRATITAPLATSTAEGA